MNKDDKLTMSDAVISQQYNGESTINNLQYRTNDQQTIYVE
jgi:hypothetical protein